MGTLPKIGFAEKMKINEAHVLPSQIENVFPAVPDGVVISSPQKEDSEKIGQLQYFPPNGTFNLMYYPYYGKKAQVRPRLKFKRWLQ